MDIAKNEADQKNLDLPVLNDVLKMFKILQEKGYDDLGTQALIKYYQIVNFRNYLFYLL